MASEQPRQAEHALDRRAFLAAGTAAGAVPALQAAAWLGATETAKKYRVAVIGHTGHGNYGHLLDRVWHELPQCQLVAVADADEQGLAAAVTRLKGAKGYLDYRRMLDEARPDLVSICPRWIDQHRDMVIAAAERGVRGIYLEKPMCRTLAEADQMIAACQSHGTTLAMAFQTRYSPKLPVIEEIIRSGAIGEVLEYRARGKEDRRGGGEDLWVLGVHLFNLIHHFGGAPRWCFGSVEQDGRPIRKEDVQPGAEGLGPLAGDSVHAMYRLESGATAYFDSKRDAGSHPSRFGLQICGSAGAIQMFTGHLPEAYLLPDPCWAPEATKNACVSISSAGLGKPEPLKDRNLPGGNALAVGDLIAAIEQDRQPLASAADGRTAIEMVLAVFESQRLGKAVSLPLANRDNPLGSL